MAHDVRMFKLVTGEIIIGKYNAEKDEVTEVASIQNVPLQQGGMQMMLLPYGIPFENVLGTSIEGKHFLYRFETSPKEIKDKYLEVSSTIAAQGGMGQLQFNKPEESKLIK